MKDITNYLEKNHVDIMVEAAAPATRDYLIIRMLWWTGMRVNELLHVRPVDLEPHTRMVRIEKA